MAAARLPDKNSLHERPRSALEQARVLIGPEARPGKAGTGFPSGRAINQKLGAGWRFDEKSSRSCRRH